MAAVEVLSCGGGGGWGCRGIFYVLDCEFLHSRSKSCKQIKVIVVYKLIYEE